MYNKLYFPLSKNGRRTSVKWWSVWLPLDQFFFLQAVTYSPQPQPRLSFLLVTDAGRFFHARGIFQ